MQCRSIDALSRAYPEFDWIEDAFPRDRRAVLDHTLNTIHDVEARTILEIGTGTGELTRLLYLACPEARIFTIDVPAEDPAARAVTSQPTPRGRIGERIPSVCPAYPTGRIVQLIGDSRAVGSYPPSVWYDVCWVNESVSLESVVAHTLICQARGTDRLTIIWNGDSDMSYETVSAFLMMAPALDIRAIPNTHGMICSRLPGVSSP